MSNTYVFVQATDDQTHGNRTKAPQDEMVFFESDFTTSVIIWKIIISFKSVWP